jgi:glycosyltransferase involved in cell wall biosynthesis
MNSNPEVTVLMAIYKDADFVKEAMDSILNQTFENFEFLIVNDGSADGSREIVGQYTDPRIRILDNDHNIGHPKSLNRGLAVARGELIARFDANDVSLRDRLAKQVRFMREHPDVAVVGGQMIAIDTYGRRIRSLEFPKPVTETGIRFYFLFDSPLIHPATMYRRSIIWDQLGGYNPTFTGEEDAELWTRVAAERKVTNLSDKIVRLRHDSRSTTYDTFQTYRAGYLERITTCCSTNLLRYLQMEIPPHWAMLAAVAPRTVPTATAAVEFAAMIDAVERRFDSLYDDAVRNREIRAFKAQLLCFCSLRVALNSRITSIRLFLRAAANDSRTALAFLPRFVGYLLLKSKAPKLAFWWRSRRRLHLLDW